MSEAREIAQNRLERDWDIVREVVKLIMKNGSINGSEFRKLVKESKLKNSENVNRSWDWKIKQIGKDLTLNQRMRKTSKKEKVFSCRSTF